MSWYYAGMDEPDTENLPCRDKLAFDTERQARAAAVVAKHQRGITLHVYQCRFCGLWHLSSTNDAD